MIAALGRAAATKAELAAYSSKAQQTVDDLTEEVRRNKAEAEAASARVSQDAKDYADTVSGNLRAEVEKSLAALRQTLDDNVKELEGTIEQVDLSVRSSLAEELEGLCEKLDQEMTNLKQELIDIIEQRRTELLGTMADQKSELLQTIEQRKTEAQSNLDGVNAELTSFINRTREEQNEANARMENQEHSDKLELTGLINQLKQDLQDAEARLALGTRDSTSEVSSDLQKFAEATNKHLADIDQLGEFLRLGLIDASEVTCRRVEWVIRDAAALRPSQSEALSFDDEAELLEGSSQDVLQLSQETSVPLRGTRRVSYFSPKFSASGFRDFQLELRATCSQDGGLGSGALYLWIPKGLQLNFRLFIAGRWTSFEKTGSDAPCGTQRVGSLAEHIGPDGCLRVGVEFLEVIVEMPHAIEDAGGMQLGPTGSSVPTLPGTLVCHRHVNNRVLTQVRKEVDHVRSRLVRRVEWQLEHASLLSRRFAAREPLCSPVFDAAGLERLQLVFYPCGYAGAMESFCSVFLYAQAGTFIHFWLCAGQIRRESKHTFEEAGAFGRTNFCRFDSCIDDKTDTVLVALEIEEAIQDLTSSAAAGPKKQLALDPEIAGWSPAQAGSVKLQKASDRHSFNETRMLPNLWSSTGLGDLTAQPDNYNTFASLKQGRKTSGHRGQRLGRPGDEEGAEQSTQPPALQHSESVTSMNRPLATLVPPLPGANVLDREDDALPLLCGQKGEWGSDQGMGSPLQWAGRSRRIRAGALRQEKLRLSP